MKTIKILIIEDSNDDFFLYNRILQKAYSNIAITHYTIGSKALEDLMKNKYDIIITDYLLIDLNGLECLKFIRDNNIDTPVIFTTGGGTEELVREAMNFKAVDYISKNNINLSSLTRMIDNSLEKYNAHKETAQKQQELELFAHTISHDLRSVIGRIQSYSSLLGKQLIETNTKDKVQSYANNISQDASYSLYFIDSLLKFAEFGRSKVDLDPVELDQIINRSIKNIEMQVQKTQAEIIYPRLPKVYGDKVSLVQLFQNLISNSIKYSKAKPYIIIESTCAKDLAQIK